MNKKFHVRTLALAVMLAATSSAFAIGPQGPGVVVLTNTSGNSWSAAIGNLIAASTTFIDVYMFTPPATPGSYAAGSVINTSIAGDGEIMFSWADLSGAPLLVGSSGGFYSPTVYNGATLMSTPVSGALILTVKGSTVTGGAYGGNLTVTMAPVPEPATYGMLISGLGILAMLARRRKQ